MCFMMAHPNSWQSRWPNCLPLTICQYYQISVDLMKTKLLGLMDVTWMSRDVTVLVDWSPCKSTNTHCSLNMIVNPESRMIQPDDSSFMCWNPKLAPENWITGPFINTPRVLEVSISQHPPLRGHHVDCMNMWNLHHDWEDTKILQLSCGLYVAVCLLELKVIFHHISSLLKWQETARLLGCGEVKVLYRRIGVEWDNVLHSNLTLGSQVHIFGFKKINQPVDLTLNWWGFNRRTWKKSKTSRALQFLYSTYINSLPGYLMFGCWPSNNLIVNHICLVGGSFVEMDPELPFVFVETTRLYHF